MFGNISYVQTIALTFAGGCAGAAWFHAMKQAVAKILSITMTRTTIHGGVEARTTVTLSGADRHRAASLLRTEGWTQR